MKTTSEITKNSSEISPKENLMEEFFKSNPFFGKIEFASLPPEKNRITESAIEKYRKEEDKIITIQQFWRKAISTKLNYPEQLSLLANDRSKKEIKDILETAAKQNRLNTNEVITLLSQRNSLICIYDLYKEKKISKEQRLRLIELYKKNVLQIHDVKRSTDKDKIDNLFNYLENGLKNIQDPSDPDPFKEIQSLLKTKDFPEVVTGLLASPKSKNLQMQQILTLLQLHQITSVREVNGKSFPTYISGMFAILDQKGEFTEEAKKYFLPTLNQINSFPSLNDTEAFDHLKKMISELPKSEQIFCVVSIPRESKGKLTNAVLHNEYTLPYISDQPSIEGFVSSSCGVRNAVGILRYGVNNFYPVLPTLGIKSMKDMEKGITDQRARLAFTYYPNTPDPGEVHESDKDSFFGVFIHDEYHSNIMSSLPEYAKQGLSKLIEVVRKKTNIEFSSEIWIWDDADFRYFNTRDLDLKSAENIVHFCSMLDTVQDIGHTYGNVLSDIDGITPAGTLIILDMVQNKEAWQKIGLDPNQLPDDDPDRVPGTARTRYGLHLPLNYKKAYELIKTIVENDPSFTSKPPIIQMTEILTYLAERLPYYPPMLLVRPEDKSPKFPNATEMRKFSSLLENLNKHNLLAITKNSINNIAVSFDKKLISFSKTPSHSEKSSNIGTIIFMSHVCSNSDLSDWIKENFLNLYKQCDAIIEKLTTIAKDATGKADLKKLAEILLQSITNVNLIDSQKIDLLKNTLDPNLSSQPKEFIESYSKKTNFDLIKYSEKLIEKYASNKQESEIKITPK